MDGPQNRAWVPRNITALQASSYSFNEATRTIPIFLQILDLVAIRAVTRTCMKLRKLFLKVTLLSYFGQFLFIRLHTLRLKTLVNCTLTSIITAKKMNSIKTPFNGSHLLPNVEPPIPSLALPSLQCGNGVNHSKPPQRGSSKETKMSTSCRLLCDSILLDQLKGNTGKKMGRQGYFPLSAVARQPVTITNSSEVTDSFASISRKSRRVCRGNVLLRFPHGLSCPHTWERPTVVDEQKAYWVVKKPLCISSLCKRKKTGTSVHGDYELACAESLASFLQGQHPKEYLPLLSSRQHNFGVIFRLEDSWIGLNIVAKTEAAYASFQRLLELQLIHTCVECFVRGPPLCSATELKGTTATGKDKLCIQVLQSTVCRTAGCDAERDYSLNNVSPHGKTSAVVSHVIFRINFPPILLPEVLRCNGVVITSNPYDRPTNEEGELGWNLCCFSLTFPQVNTHAPRDGIAEDLSENSPDSYAVAGNRFSLSSSAIPSRGAESGKSKIDTFSFAGRLPTMSSPLPSVTRLWLYTGLFTVSPVVLYKLLPQILRLLEIASESNVLSVQTASIITRGFVYGISRVRQLLEMSDFPIIFTNLIPWLRKLNYVDVEILFGEAEGRRWLEMSM